jgi:glycosyltransferase involved in cell wall biosynthesis
VHTCPSEAFGLAIVEGMAAGVPVLVPDAGGAGSLVEQGISGYRFRADDADDLACRLQALCAASGEELNRVVAGASAVLRTRFSEKARLGDYRTLIRDLQRPAAAAKA